MTVRDLIETLQKFDADTRVMIKDIEIESQSSSFEIIDAEYSAYGGRVVDLVIKEIS